MSYNEQGVAGSRDGAGGERGLLRWRAPEHRASGGQHGSEGPSDYVFCR